MTNQLITSNNSNTNKIFNKNKDDIKLINDTNGKRNINIKDFFPVKNNMDILKEDKEEEVVAESNTKIDTKTDKKLRKVADKANNKETYNFLSGIPYMDKSNNNSKLYTIFDIGDEEDKKKVIQPLLDCLKFTKSLAEKKVHDKLKLISQKRGDHDLDDDSIKNIYIPEDILSKELDRLDISGACAKSLGPVICGGCSGLNKNNKPVYRVFNMPLH